MKLEDLKAGDWILMKYGHSDSEFYVLETMGDNIKVGRAAWCVSSSMWLTPYDKSNIKGRLGSTKSRWWWKFLPFKDIVCPFKKRRL